MSDGVTAVVEPVPRAERGRVLTPANAWIENGLYLLQVLVFVGIAFAPMIVGGLMATGQILLSRDEATFFPALVGLGLTATLMWLLIGQLLRKPWSAQFIFTKTQNELLRRADSIVAADNPDAILAEIIPRRNWGQLVLQNAEDRGFLFIDQDKRRILFEGDHKRYQIPADAILHCNMETMNPGAANDGVPVGLVVLSVRDAMGPREVPVRPIRTVAGDPLGRNYIERSRVVRQRILELVAMR